MANETFKDIEKLEADLWEAADNLRANSKITSSDYFMPVLGVIFLRHAANRFEAAARGPGNGLAQIGAIGRAFVDFSRAEPVYYDALSKFAMHSPAGADGDANEHRCLAAGDRVHDVFVACIERGIADGSIRADAGPPALLSLTLWGYMLGVIQLAATKSAVLEHRGFDAGRVIDQALALATDALGRR